MRPKDDNSSDSVHELYGEAADLRIFHCGIFPEEGSACDDWTLCIWNCDGNFNGTDL